MLTREDTRILITGSSGMVGSALVKRLKKENKKLLTPSRLELDLREQKAVFAYFAEHKPDYVFHLAAIVGGIYANNTYPATFIYENTQMHCHVIHAAHQYGVKKLLFPGSACSYPKFADQPIKESAFLEGPIEPTNIAYAAAKVNGIVMCQAYARQYGLNTVIPMPTNAYGIGDHFESERSHVIPSLMKRFHDAKLHGLDEVILWGSGTPLREFIYVDDLADALLFLMEHQHTSDIINVGTMQEITILQLAEKIAGIIGYKGKIILDQSKPDGMPRKCLDSTPLLRMGFLPHVSLDEGLSKTYAHHFG